MDVDTLAMKYLDISLDHLTMTIKESSCDLWSASDPRSQALCIWAPATDQTKCQRHR
jgi:hypothetical protein